MKYKGKRDTLFLCHNIPGSYSILLFTASDFTSITSHTHNWALFCCGVWFQTLFYPFLRLAGDSPLPLDVGYRFWWDPPFFCQWFFSSELQFWNSSKRRTLGLSYSMSGLVPRPELNLGPLHWELGVLAAGPPAKSPQIEYIKPKRFLFIGIWLPNWI